MQDLMWALNQYERDCRVPQNLPDMMSWEGRKDGSRSNAVQLLDSIFTGEQLRSLHDLTSYMLQDVLAEESEGQP